MRKLLAILSIAALAAGFCFGQTATLANSITGSAESLSTASTLPAGTTLPGYTGAITRATDAVWGVSTANTAAANQSAFASVAAAVNAGTSPAYIYLPEGTYNVLSTAGSALGTYTVPITFHCADNQKTIINQSGTGNLVQFGATGLSNSSAVNQAWRFENCQVTGGGTSGADGIVIEPWNMVAWITDDYFVSYGNASSYAIDDYGPNYLYVKRNYWLPMDGATSHNFLYHRDAGGVGWNLDDITDNYIVCYVSATNWNTAACGIGVWITTGSAEILTNNVFSGPQPDIRITGNGTSGGLSNIVANNYIENFNADIASTYGAAIELGATSGTTTVYDTDIHDNYIYCNNAGDSLVGPTPGGITTLKNSNISQNHNRSYLSTCSGTVYNSLNLSNVNLSGNVNLGSNDAVAYSDSFQYSNGALAGNALWTNAPTGSRTTTSLSVSSNTVVVSGSSADGAAYYNASLNLPYYSQFTIGVPTNGGGYPGPTVQQSASADTRYELDLGGQSGCPSSCSSTGTSVILNRISAGSDTAPVTYTYTWGAGTIIRLQVGLGGVLTSYASANGGASWTQLGQYVDSTPLANGYPGIHIGANDTTNLVITNWQAGAGANK